MQPKKYIQRFQKLKKKNNGFSNIDPIDGFIGYETYK